ncbi:MAG: methylated-DNA--[protein]-cysteine S-methyltransferase [Cephaloticoccus sp.]
MPAATFDTPIGTCRLSWTDYVLTGFGLPGDGSEGTSETAAPRWIDEIMRRVQAHLAGHHQDFSDLPYAFDRVADFPKQVYQCTLLIKPGTTWSYGDIARELGYPPSTSRAVGSALGANPWPLLVPCHRVVAADGKMTGFSGPGGVETKLRLLAIEGAQLFDV